MSSSGAIVPQFTEVVPDPATPPPRHTHLVTTEYMRHIFVNASFRQDRECKTLDIPTDFPTQMFKFGFPTIVTIYLSIRNLTATQFWSKVGHQKIPPRR